MKRNAVVMAASWALAALLLCGADTRAKVGSRMTPAQGSKPGDGESPFRTSGRPLRSIGPAGPVDTATLGEDVTAESHDGPARPPRGYELTPQALRAFREARLAARRSEEGTSAEPPTGTEPASFVLAGSLEQVEAPPGDGIALDPSDGTFWTIGAFATGTSTECRRNGWGTHVTQIRW